MQIDKVYEPQRFEPHWANWWVDERLFHVEAAPGQPYFSLVIPPPNVTGSLHMGHMFEHAIIDAQIRWRRMTGIRTLWLPGTDHAGIATELMVDRQLAKEGLTKRELGREKFVERVWKWKEEFGGRIVEQMKRAGLSCDWSRQRFTMDAGLSRAVREAFVRLYDKGLIYRAHYIVNWCPRCQTVLSDLEVQHEEMQGHLWHIRYPVEGSDLKLVVATTRPETMLGDTAVAINPKDPRAPQLEGKFARLPLMERPIPIVLDEMAELGFGSGAVKITPAHDPHDFEAGRRHNLPSIQVIDQHAKMTAEAREFAGLDRFEARKQVVKELEKRGLLEKVEPYALNAGICHRCKTLVEPLVSKQWWMSMKPLAAPAIKAVEEGRIQFVPANWAKTYYEWMYNIRDWCISRQLWWGHRIPVWYCGGCGKIVVAREDPDRCTHCGSEQLEQETDVLDTWFSSGLWPFSTLGWPDDTADLRSFYPTSLLVTGFDIIFFWCARMIMLGLEMMGEVPFRQVHIHGLVRDAERQKMSKTKGNTIDPLVINDKYGTDAVRFALLVSAAPGNDIALSEDRIDAERAFANKIWNASRLVFGKPREGSGKAQSLADRWIGSRLNACAKTANTAFEQHRYHEAAETLYHFWWGDFCDWYLEFKKAETDWSYAYQVYEKALRLLHPLMPFITEELWHRLDLPGKSIALAEYPRFDSTEEECGAEERMQLVQELVTEARTLRADNKIDPRRKMEAAYHLEIDEERRGMIERLANVALTFDPHLKQRLRLDIAVDRGRLARECAELEKQIAALERQLSNPEFLNKAPEKVIAAMRAKRAEYAKKLLENRAALGE